MQKVIDKRKLAVFPEKAIEFSGTPSNLKVALLRGKFSGFTFKLTGEMIEGGRFWAYPKAPFFMILPEERKLSEDERAQVIEEIKKFSDRIEFE